MEQKIEKKSNNKKYIIFVILLLLIICVAGGVLAYKITNDKRNADEKNVEEKIEENTIQNEEPIVVEVEEPKINIYSGDDRPIAVMIDNHKKAQPQGGLNSAFIVYEIIVEGGESRLMAIFKGASVDKIGPIRSSRHYYLDYALENDAIYVHYGWSPQAQSDIPKLRVQNINGITESEKMFWRTKDKSAPHNVAISTKNILSIAEKKGYRTTSANERSLLNYSAKEIELENGEIANKVTIPYSASNVVVYNYDEQNKNYIRYSKGSKQVDWSTKEDVTTKNIIITFVQNYVLNDGENKDRQGLKNIGKMKGYYITNGKAIPITCTKNNRTEKTIYEDLDGNEIQVNDGRTFIQICPIDSNVEIEI